MLEIVRFFWHATGRCSNDCSLIYLCRQQSEMNVCWHYNSGQSEGVFSGIADVTQGVEYSMYDGTNVATGPEQLGVGVSSQHFQLAWETHQA
jgi:hypothetical protein